MSDVLVRLPCLQAALTASPASLLCSSLGVSAHDRLSGDLARVKMSQWRSEDFKQLVADKLKAFEREFKELHMLLFPEVLQTLALYDR